MATRVVPVGFSSVNEDVVVVAVVLFEAGVIEHAAGTVTVTVTVLLPWPCGVASANGVARRPYARVERRDILGGCPGG